MGFQAFKMQERGEELAGRFHGHKQLRSKQFDAGNDGNAPAVVDMAIYHFSGGVADVRIGASIFGTLGDGQDYDTVFAGPKVRVAWRGKTAVTVSVLTGTRSVMEVFSPV